ncbi:hypothetical protein F5050DRAFT_1809260 [Lentinula boryana]|uniref:Fungal-type protein kinase domain-containing protein n=1 Tax=Lentinula boryana TaxID=40481 RepID=A0ABQ8Q8G9_9AGAR|nr:hypothetical protein F5050DRAFT_1809260 [Lentinula boryana]
MPPHKKRKLTQADLERNSSSYVNRSAPQQIMSSLSRSGLSTTTQIIGAPSVQQEKGSAIPPEPTSTTSLYAEESKPELDFVEESRTQRAKLLVEYQEFLPTTAKLLMMQESDLRIVKNRGPTVVPVTAPFFVIIHVLVYSAFIPEPTTVSALSSPPALVLSTSKTTRRLDVHFSAAVDMPPAEYDANNVSNKLLYAIHAGWERISINLSTGLRHGMRRKAIFLGIPLGHDGNRCPYATTPLLMTLVDVGGVHTTRVTFYPQSAFTLNLLQQWDLFNLQSKITAYQFMLSLRRLTDNVFTGNVLDLYKQFLFVTRIWPWIQMEKCFGGLYGDGMTECFPHRPKDNVMNFCPACPDTDVNMEDGWECAPSHLRHIHSSRITIDGNMKTGNYTKKNDPNDVSLFDGRAYMANSKRYKHYLKTVPQLQNEKVTCNHLNVANGASCSKFKNLRVIGTVNVHCDHYMVGSSVDIIGAERFATVDFALELFHEAWPFKGKQPDKLISYDYACGLTPNISDRFHQYHPTQAPIIDNAQWIIPSCHVRNHIEGCNYLYSYLYKSSTGHFYGESAEAPWDTFNQLGSSVMQMSAGHRIDTLINHYNNWNWRKTVGIGAEGFRLRQNKVCEWTQLDCSPIIDPHNKKQVLSVYSHGDNKAPSLKSLVDKLMSSKETVPMSFGKVKLAGVAAWLHEGLLISRDQWGNRGTRETAEKSQESYLKVAKEAETMKLLLPSDFSALEQNALSLAPLAGKQVQLLESALGDVINSLQTVVKTLTAACERKVKEDRGQKANICSHSQIRTIQTKRDELILDYSTYRRTLCTLGALDELWWPELTVQDTFRKATERRRTPGNSRILEGNLWNMTTAGHSAAAAQVASGAIFGSTLAIQDINEEQDPTIEDMEDSALPTKVLAYQGTKMSTHQSRLVKVYKAPALAANNSLAIEEEEVGVKADGWIWKAGRLENMSPKEIEEWEETENRVQWFRAEADFERWQEQIEIKHADFQRVIASFTYYRDAWMRLSSQNSLTPGHCAYAREHSDMFESLRMDAQAKYDHCGIDILKNVRPGHTLADRILLWHAGEEKMFSFDRWASRPDFHDPTIPVVPALSDKLEDFWWKLWDETSEPPERRSLLGHAIGFVGHSLVSAKDLHSLVLAVVHAHTGYYNMCVKNYQHRDLSIGNVLMVDEPIKTERFDIPNPNETQREILDLCRELGIDDQCTGFVIDGDMAVTWDSYFTEEHVGTKSGTSEFMSSMLLNPLNKNHVHSPVDDYYSFYFLTQWACAFRDLSPEDKPEEPQHLQQLRTELAGGLHTRSTATTTITGADLEAEVYGAFLVQAQPFLRKWVASLSTLTSEWRRIDASKRFNAKTFREIADRGFLSFLRVVAELKLL